MDIVYCDGKGNNIAVVYEVSSATGQLHTIRLEDVTKLDVHDSNLGLLNRPDFFNIPKTPVDSRNEVVTSLSLEEAQDLGRPRTLSPIQKYLMSWHHRLYHLPLRILFFLSSIGFLTKRLP